MLNKKEIIVISSIYTKGCGISSFTGDLTSYFEAFLKIKSIKLKLSFRSNPIIYFFQATRLFFNVLLFKNFNSSVKNILLEYTPTTTGPLIYPLVFLLKKINNLKVILEIHENTEVYNKSIFYKFFVLQEAKLIKICDNVIVHNEIHANYVLKKYGEYFDKKKLRIIPIPLFKPNKTKFNTPKFRERKDFIVFGQIRKSKNYDLLIKAYSKFIKRNANTRHDLLIAGNTNDNGYLKEIKNYVSLYKINERVKFLGYIDDKEMVNLFKNSLAIVLLYSKVTQSYPFSLSISHGLPSITSDLEYFTNFFKIHKTGLSSSLDLNSIVEKMENISSNEKTYSIMQKKCKEAMDKYSPNIIARDYEKLFD